jgi:hypothetical protein
MAKPIPLEEIICKCTTRNNLESGAFGRSNEEHLGGASIADPALKRLRWQPSLLDGGGSIVYLSLVSLMIPY